MLPPASDVVVVGAGNAALCAALAAAEHVGSVLVLERSPKEVSGGNSRFTAGAFRCVYDGVDDLKALMPDLTESEIAISDFGTYTQDKFFDDMGRVTEYRTDPDLCEQLVTRSKETMLWMRHKGVRFVPIWGRQAYKIEGRFKFWGGLTVEAWGGGPGLIERLTEITQNNNITIAYEARALSLTADDEGVKGLVVRHKGKTVQIAAKCIVLAAGGFQANAYPLSWPRLGASEGPWHPVQHWRRHQDGARYRRDAHWQLVWLPCGRLGPQRAGIRRPRGRRRISEALLSVEYHDQRQR
jgi:tricarballylate dehydrogenase